MHRPNERHDKSNEGERTKTRQPILQQNNSTEHTTFVPSPVVVPYSWRRRWSPGQRRLWRGCSNTTWKKDRDKARTKKEQQIKQRPHHQRHCSHCFWSACGCERNAWDKISQVMAPFSQRYNHREARDGYTMCMVVFVVQFGFYSRRFEFQIFFLLLTARSSMSTLFPSIIFCIRWVGSACVWILAILMIFGGKK